LGIDRMLRHSFCVVPTQDVVAQFLSTFKDYPSRQRPSSFSVDQIIEKFMNATTPKGQ
jgi:arylsulfatase